MHVLIQGTERFVAIYPFLKELALTGSHRSKATRPVAQQLLPLMATAISEGKSSALSSIYLGASRYIIERI